MLNEKQLDNFKSFAKLRENINFSDELTCEIIKQSFELSYVYIAKLETYLSEQSFQVLLNNIWLHFIIVDPLMEDLYHKYDISNKEFIINSASNSGSSTSMQSFKSLEEGEYLMINLNRTPYGRIAYSILESIKNVAIIV